MEIDIVDVTLSTDDSGETRINLGDQNSGVGFSAGATTWGAGDGFIGIPNGPDTSGDGCAQALMMTQGNQRLALAMRDVRWDGQAGPLSLGDRAIVSNCDAALLLNKAANKISLLGNGASIELDADNITVTITIGSAVFQVTPSNITGQIGNAAKLEIGQTKLILSYGSVTTLAVGPSGIDIMTPPPTPPATSLVRINGVPLSVP